jgi:integrating conjugative element protein (TIGR03749 family)
MIRALLCLTLGMLASAAQAMEIRHWQRLPLSVPLAVGHERVIFLDQPVRVGVPAALTGKLRVQSANGALYLLASAPFTSTRLHLQLPDSGELILLDLAADADQPALEPLRIVREDQATDFESVPTATPTPIPVALVRYAAQQLYAPLRTVEPLPGVRPVRLSQKADLNHLLPSDPVSARPLAAWRLAEYTVTAVLLRNQTANPVELDPRRLSAQLYAASFQHDHLGAQGSPEDTSVAYLVTRDGGLEHALLVAPFKEAGDER